MGGWAAGTAGDILDLSEMKDGHYVVEVGIVNPRDNSELRSTAVDVTIDTGLLNWYGIYLECMRADISIR